MPFTLSSMLKGISSSQWPPRMLLVSWFVLFLGSSSIILMFISTFSVMAVKIGKEKRENGCKKKKRVGLRFSMANAGTTRTMLRRFQLQGNWFNLPHIKSKSPALDQVVKIRNFFCPITLAEQRWPSASYEDYPKNTRSNSSSSKRNLQKDK